MHEVVKFNAGDRTFTAPVPSERKQAFFELNNFGLIMPDRYRGAWPKDLQFVGLLKLSVSSVLTLVNFSDQQTIQRLHQLESALQEKNIHHIIVDAHDAETFFTAARLLLETTKPSYLHCSSCANRTGIVTMITSLMQQQLDGKIVDENVVTELLSEAISYGFDFDKPDRKKDMEDVLVLAIISNLIR